MSHNILHLMVVSINSRKVLMRENIWLAVTTKVVILLTRIKNRTVVVTVIIILKLLEYKGLKRSKWRYMHFTTKY